MKSEKDNAFIGGQSSSASTFTFDSAAKNTTKKPKAFSAAASVTSRGSAATTKTRRKKIQDKLRKKMWRKSVTVTTLDGYAESRDVENESHPNYLQGSESCESAKSSGTWKSRRHTVPSLSFGYGKRQRSCQQVSLQESGNPAPTGFGAPIGFGAVPPSAKKAHKLKLKTMLSPKTPATIMNTKANQEAEDSAGSVPLNKRYYLTKTSIMQHSIHVNSNDEPYDEGTSSRQGNSELHLQDSEHKNIVKGKVGSQRQATRTEESIECIFSTMSFRDSNQMPSESEEKTEDDTGNGESSMQNHQTPLQGDTIDNEHVGLGSFFQLCSNPDVVDDVNIDGDLRSSTKSPISFWHFLSSPRGEFSESKGQIQREPTVVHVTDIVSQKRDFTMFLKAYDELLENSKQQTPHTQVANLPQDPIPDSTVLGKNDLCLCPYCPKFSPCSVPPPPPPNCWPQYPICLRATPGTGMRILGVRFSSSNKYLGSPFWWDSLGIANPEGFSNVSTRVRDGEATTVGDKALCENCQLLPINSGFEANGRALVIDFESNLFIGTLLMRIRNSRPLKEVATLGTAGADYFSTANRKYQAVIRGEFKRQLPARGSVTGQVFPHEVTNLPSKLWLKTALSVISVFAPQLQANIDGNALEGIHGPSFISPLASTPQTVIVQSPQHYSGEELDAASFVQRRHADISLDRPLVEPATDSKESLVSEYTLQQAKAGVLSGASTSATKKKSASATSSSDRAKVRKKCLDKEYAQGPDNESCFTFQPGKIYTFEFLQHLLNFETATLEVGTSMKLNETLNGQPLKFMAANLEKVPGQSIGSAKNGPKTSMMRLNHLWSFDIWHQGLYQDALTCSELESSRTAGKAHEKKPKKR